MFYLWYGNVTRNLPHVIKSKLAKQIPSMSVTVKKKKKKNMHAYHNSFEWFLRVNSKKKSTNF